MPRKKKPIHSDNANVALCYVRQSYTRDDNDMNSPDRQRANIQLICEQNGWTPEWYEDAEGHKSGTKVKNRPGWLALKKRLSDPDIVALVANDLSRLHRKGWRIGDLLDFVDEHDVKLILAAPGKQMDFSTPQGRIALPKLVHYSMSGMQSILLNAPKIVLPIARKKESPLVFHHSEQFVMIMVFCNHRLKVLG